MKKKSNVLLSLPPQSVEDAFLDIRAPHWTRPDGPFAFLRMFKASLLVYFGDSETIPVIHTYGVDGISPNLKAYPDPKKQENGYGMFFSVNGFKSTQRTKDNLYSLNGIFVDIDYPDKKTVPTAQQMRAFKSAVIEDLTYCNMSDREAFGEDPEHAECPPPTTAIVETKNGYHVYWMFEHPILMDHPKLDDDLRKDLLRTYEKVLKAVVKRFQGDPVAAEAARVLRVPGSYHLKDPADPYLVNIVHFDREMKYTFAELRKFWLKNKNAESGGFAYVQAEEVKKEAEKHKPTKATKELKGMFKKAGEKDLTDDEWQEIEKAYPHDTRPSTELLLSPSGIKEGQRNRCLLIVSSALRSAGWSEDRVLQRILPQGYSGLSEYEIRQTIRSAFRSVVPYVFTWNDPILAEYITVDEISTVMKHILNIRHKRQSYDSSPNSLPHSSAHNDGDGESQVADDVVAKRDQPSGSNARSERSVGGIPKSYTILPAEVRKNMFDHFEIEFCETYPQIVYVEDSGFFERMDDGAWYRPLEFEHVFRMMNRLLYDRGLADKRGTSQIQAKVNALMAYPPMCMDRSGTEFVFNSTPGTGTFLNLKKGVLDIDSGKMVPRLPDMFFTHSIDADPLNDSKCPEFEKFVYSICRSKEGQARTENRVKLLQEIMGYCLTPYNHFQKAFMFIGNGSNGKSTLVDLFVKILGDENVSYLTLDQLNGKYNLHSMYRKRINTIDEIRMNEKSYVDSEMLKKSITGQRISAELKFVKNLFSFSPFCKFIISANKFPKITDTGHALYRRFLVFPFERNFDLEGIADKRLPEKLWAERSGVLRWVMEGWQRLQKNDAFTDGAGSEQWLDDFKEQNSPLVEYMLTDYIFQHEASLTPISEREERWILPMEEIYDGYRLYAAKRGYGVKSFRSFVQEVAEFSHSRLQSLRVKKIIATEYLVGIQRKQAALPFARTALE
ncbi:MAG: phage/plasmid primase, P4 family [Patescibacteria group bacterium]